MLAAQPTLRGILLCKENILHLDGLTDRQAEALIRLVETMKE